MPLRCVLILSETSSGLSELVRASRKTKEETRWEVTEEAVTQNWMPEIRIPQVEEPHPHPHHGREDKAQEDQ